MPYNPGITDRRDLIMLQAGNNIASAIQRYQNMRQTADAADYQMQMLSQMPDPTDPETDPEKRRTILDKKNYERWLSLSDKQKAASGSEVLGALKMYHSLQDTAQQAKHQEAQDREILAHANYLIGANPAAAGGAGGAGPRGKIWSNELGGWATPAQADAARRRTTQGFLQQSYGLTPEQIFDSSQHEAGTVTIDPTTGAKKFINDPKGDQIRIGGPQGVIMPIPEHNIYKRQLQMQGFQVGGGAPGMPGGAGAGGAAQDPNQARAIAILQQNGKPLTPGNINYVIQQLSSGQ